MAIKINNLWKIIWNWKNPEYEYYCLRIIFDCKLVDVWWNKESVFPKIYWDNSYKILFISGLWLDIDISFFECDYSETFF